VVIESDDWGSIRTPSAEVYRHLSRIGYKPDDDPYMKYDSLESNDDMTCLFEVLSSVKDAKGDPAVLTANSVVANPDFEAIARSGFTTYHYEPFTTTLDRYPGRSEVYRYWKEGIANKLFVPQYHGREHLHVEQWMKALQKGDKLQKEAFELGMISISSMPSRFRCAFMEGLEHFDGDSRELKKEILITGHRLFVEKTGITPLSFIANCYIWDEHVEQVIHELGICTMQGTLYQDMGENKRRRLHYTGEKNSLGLYYTVRNSFFEPSVDQNFNWVDECLSRIKIAFRWHKPAIISSHRLNFIGSIDVANRDRNLASLRTLLQTIIKTWPDVEFIHSGELAEVISSSKNGIK
jgi:hypothetical protein